VGSRKSEVIGNSESTSAFRVPILSGHGEGKTGDIAELEELLVQSEASRRWATLPRASISALSAVSCARISAEESGELVVGTVGSKDMGTI
jgi:hypothetical protein